MADFEKLIKTVFSSIAKNSFPGKSIIKAIIAIFSALGLLFSYAEEEHLIKRGKISIELFYKDTIVAFLEWLELKRGASVSTRNQRLAALKSFS